MKKNNFLMLLIILITSAAGAQTKWVIKKLDNKFAVKFPFEPEKTTKDGIDTYTLKQKDSVIYTSGAIDFKTIANIDSATLAPMKEKQGFADQMIKGMASKRQNYTFGDVTIGTWNNLTAYDVSAIENTTKSKLFVKVIFIGSKCYTLVCRIPEALPKKNK